MATKDDRVVVLTGVGRGLRRSHALALAARGVRVVINDARSDVRGGGAASAIAESVATEISARGGCALATQLSIVEAEGLFHTIRDYTADVLGGWNAIVALQSGGGLHAQRVVARKHYDVARAVSIARRWMDLRKEPEQVPGVPGRKAQGDQ